LKAAEKTVQTPEQFYLALEEFFNWMEGTDNSFTRLSDETCKTEVIQNKDLCNLYLEEFRVSGPLILILLFSLLIMNMEVFQSLLVKFVHVG
jgi:hypothetical protein